LSADLWLGSGSKVRLPPGLAGPHDRLVSHRLKRFARRLVRAGFRMTLLLTVVALAGTTYGAFHEQRQRAQFPPPGRLVDVGDGQQVHVRTWGQRAPGSPAIILDVSAMMPSSAFSWLARELANDYHVVAYDRPGMGWSRGGSGPRDARAAADALSRALVAAGIGPPYVVVGHSFGGLSARVFAQAHRDDIVALVLLDTTHPDGGGGQWFGRFARSRALAGHLGLWQLLPRPPDDLAGLPADDAPAALAVSLWTSHLDASADELEAWDASVAQARGAGDFGDLPLLVAAAYGSDGQFEHQRDIARLSTRSELADLRHLGHVQMLTDERQAAELGGHIRRFLAKHASAGVLEPGGNTADGQVDQAQQALALRIGPVQAAQPGQ